MRKSSLLHNLSKWKNQARKIWKTVFQNRSLVVQLRETTISKTKVVKDKNGKTGLSKVSRQKLSELNRGKHRVSK